MFIVSFDDLFVCRVHGGCFWFLSVPKFKIGEMVMVLYSFDLLSRLRVEKYFCFVSFVVMEEFGVWISQIVTSCGKVCFSLLKFPVLSIIKGWKEFGGMVAILCVFFIFDSILASSVEFQCSWQAMASMMLVSCCLLWSLC